MTTHPAHPSSAQWGKVRLGPSGDGLKWHRIVAPDGRGHHIAACRISVVWAPGIVPPSLSAVCNICTSLGTVPATTPESNVSFNKIVQLTTQIAALQAEVARLSMMPSEPLPNSDDPMPTIRFQIQFEPGGLTYHYAARRTGAKWYTTGSRSGATPREWDDLVAWIDRSHVEGIQGAHLRLMIAGKTL